MTVHMCRPTSWVAGRLPCAVSQASTVAAARLVLLYVVAFWAITTGIMQVFTAIRLRKQLEGEWMLMLGGVLSVVFGLIILFAPVSGALVISWWLGVFAFVYGIVLSILGFRLRRHQSASLTGTTEMA